jgi:tRNA threonylcarbamoyladenosine biosynthesis protein TsaE
MRYTKDTSEVNTKEKPPLAGWLFRDTLMAMEIRETKTLEDFKEVIRQFFETISFGGQATVIALVGDLGAGKTTAVQQMASLLGIDQAVTSPTFTVAQFYRDFTHPHLAQLIHVDAYRLNEYQELKKLGFESWCQDGGNIICIEWPNQVAVPDAYISYTISIEHKSGGGRLITIT